MGRARIVLTLVFVLALGAGVTAGMLVSRAATPGGVARADPPPTTPLGAELGLTAEQSAKMHEIWERVRDDVDACFLRAQELQRRRDEALVGLLTAEQRAKFARAQQEYSDALAALKAQRDGAFREAVKRTEQVLNESQRKRYREILSSRLGQGAAGGSPDWMPTPARPDQTESARPATEGATERSSRSRE